MNRAVAYLSHFGIETIEIQTEEMPNPGPGEVLIAVDAVALNYRDHLMVQGAYDPKVPLPLVPCSDMVGRIVGLGAGVEGVEVGHRVLSLFSPGWTDGAPHRAALRQTLGGQLPGVLATHVVLRADSVVRAPSYLSDVQACTLCCAGLTAYSALFSFEAPTSGNTVLTIGSGGVSLFALQLAKSVGCRVIAVTRTEEKVSLLRAAGADEVIVSEAHPRWGRHIAKTFGGVHQVIEVGGAGTLSNSLAATRPSGMISLIGVLSGVQEPLSVLPILMNQLRVQGVFVGHRRSLEELVRHMEHHQLKPTISQVFPFQATIEAFALQASGEQFGKVVIEMPQ